MFRKVVHFTQGIDENICAFTLVLERAVYLLFRSG